jgi:hypothetical protein
VPVVGLDRRGRNESSEQDLREHSGGVCAGVRAGARIDATMSCNYRAADRGASFIAKHDGIPQE